MTDDPASQARETFRRHLVDLHESVGRPSYQLLIETMKDLRPRPGTIPRGTSTLSDLLRGQWRRAPAWETVEAFVRACARDGQTTADLDVWRERYNRLDVVLDATGTRRPAASAAPQTPPAAVPGRLIAELTDPFALEVHPAIDAGAKAAGLPALPAYIPRDHDKQLGMVVRRAAGGDSALAVLVGGSYTGKTRACWEALTLLPAGWRLWHPINPDRPDAALAELPRIGPRTVVWLNEAQHYLLTPTPKVGDSVAAGLRDLLRNGDRGPVLVVGTIWPGYRATLTTTPADGQPDPHPHARALLTNAAIDVPDTFTGPALDALAAAAGSDPRLADAQAHAEQGQITQYLAGAPALLERYRTAPAPARALIEVAMDARRLGHYSAMPHALLEAATPGYLTDQQWDTLPGDWLKQALTYAAAPIRGTRGPLTRIRPRPGQPTPAQPHYRLADYLDQHARIHRRTLQAPAALWDALLTHTTSSDDAVRLGNSAEDRLLYGHAIPFYRHATNTGDRNAARQLATLLAKCGDLDELRTRANTGDQDAAMELAELLAGRWDLGEAMHEDLGEAIQILQPLANTGNQYVAMKLADLLANRGDLDELRTRANTGDLYAAARLADLLAKHGDLDELRTRANTGDPNAAERLADLLAERGDDRLRRFGFRADGSIADGPTW